MKMLLLPLILLLFGIGGGVGAGILLKPAADTDQVESDEEGADITEDAVGEVESPEVSDNTGGGVEFLKMSNQFIIPLVEGGVVNGIVVTSVSLEVVEGTIAAVDRLEPKIRDQFLQVFFNHANNGGFKGNFTEFRYLKSLKEELLRNAQLVAGQDVRNVLILDLVRQMP